MLSPGPPVLNPGCGRLGPSVARTRGGRLVGGATWAPERVQHVCPGCAFLFTIIWGLWPTGSRGQAAPGPLSFTVDRPALSNKHKEVSSAGPFQTSLAHGLQLVTGHGDVFLLGLQRGQSFGSHRTRGSHLLLRRCGPSCDLRRSWRQLSAFWNPLLLGSWGREAKLLRSHAAGRGAEHLICSFPQRAGGSEPEAQAVVAEVFSRQKQTVWVGGEAGQPPKAPPPGPAAARPLSAAQGRLIVFLAGGAQGGAAPTRGRHVLCHFSFLELRVHLWLGQISGNRISGTRDCFLGFCKRVFSAEVRQDASSREG